MPFRFSVISKRQVFADVLPEGGASLLGEDAFLAFVQPGLLPGAADWVRAHWTEATPDGNEGLAVTVGPNDGLPPSVDTTLGPGTYSLWVKIVTRTEEYAEQIDTVTITGAGSRVLVVSVAELADYMGFGQFADDSVTAVADRLAELQGEAEDYLRADLTNQQWTETYTVPLDGPAPFVSPYIGYDYQNLFPASGMGFNMGAMTGEVILEHWPITEWVALAVNNQTAVAQAGLVANANYVPGVATLTDTTSGATGAVVAINGSPNVCPPNATIYNLTVTAGDTDINVGDRITVSDGAGHTLSGIVAVGGVQARTTSSISVGAGGFNTKEPVWIPVVPPTYPEQLPTFAPGTQVQVTYRAGWDGPNIDTIKSTIKRAAARELTNRLDDAVGLRGMSIVRLPDPGGQQAAAPGLTDADKARISRYKKRMIVG